MTKVRYIDTPYPIRTGWTKVETLDGKPLTYNMDNIKSVEVGYDTPYLKHTDWGFTFPKGDGSWYFRDFYGTPSTATKKPQEAVNGRYKSMYDSSVIGTSYEVYDGAIVSTSKYISPSEVWGNEIFQGTLTPYGEFLKHDEGKTEYHHIPWDVIEDVAEVLTEGEKKYPGENWKKCTDKNRYFNALDRHLMDWRLGETEDADSGQSHLVHAICNLLFLAKLEKDGKI